MGIFLLSLAGVPLTMGFVGRLHLVSVSVRDVHLGLVAPALLNLLVCFYYTTRMVLDLFADPALKEEDEGVEVGKGIAVSLLVCTFVIVAVGVWPEPCLALVKQVAMEFF